MDSLNEHNCKPSLNLWGYRPTIQGGRNPNSMRTSERRSGSSVNLVKTSSLTALTFNNLRKLRITNDSAQQQRSGEFHLTSVCANAWRVLERAVRSKCVLLNNIRTNTDRFAKLLADGYNLIQRFSETHRVDGG